MSKRTILCLSIVFLFLVALAIFVSVLLNFFSPGVHYLGDAIHFETGCKVYIMDLHNDASLVEESQFGILGTLDGIPYNGGCGSFHGIIEVSAYPIPIAESCGIIANEGRGVLGVRDGEYIRILYSGVKLTSDENGFSVSSDYHYTLYLNPERPNQFIVIITDAEKNHPVRSSQRPRLRISQADPFGVSFLIIETAGLCQRFFFTFFCQIPEKSDCRSLRSMIKYKKGGIFLDLLSILLTAVNAVVPIILLILLGYILRQRGALSDGFLQTGNKLVFKLMLPVMLFMNVYSIDSLANIQWDITLYSLLAIVVIFLLALGACILTTPVAQRRGVILQCCFRSNFVIIGLPLASALGGAEAEAVAAVLSAVSVPLFNVLAVISLSVFVEQKGSFSQNCRRILRDIFTNPLILAVAMALLCLAVRWVQLQLFGQVVFSLQHQTGFFFSALNMLKNATTPVALIILGGQFVFSAVKALKKEIIVATFWRIVLSPILGIGGAMLLSHWQILHCGPAHYPALVALFGSPVAVSSAIMAKGMGNDEQLATQLVVWTTLCSGITVFLLVCCLMALGMIPIGSV